MPVTCGHEQAERLGRAVRFRTATSTSGSPRGDPRYGKFASSTAFLEETFPRAAAEPAWGGWATWWEKPPRVTDAVVAPFLVVGTTDSRLFTGLTDTIVRFMPLVMTSKDPARIHGVNERISLEDYGRMIAYYGNVIREAGR